MSTLSYIDSMWIDVLAWTIVHSLWQGMLIGGMVWILVTIFGTKSAGFRHNLHLSGLVSFFTLNMITIAILYRKAIGSSSPEIDGTLPSNIGWSDSGLATLVKDDSIYEMTLGLISEHTGLIFFIWLSGMILFSVKLMWQVSASYWLRQAGIELCPQEWTTRWKEIVKNYKAGDRVSFRLSSIVESPVVTGFLKPVILFPVASVNHLTIEQVEAILHHEMSHLARNDQWWNLFISLMETVYYYHPVVWIMTSQVKMERENSVDDRVLEMGVDPLKYAESLMVLQSIKKQHRQLALGAVGSKGELLLRIKRILGQPQKTNTMKQKLSSVLVIGLLMIAWGISTGFSGKAIDVESVTKENVIASDSIPASVSGKVTVIDKKGVKTEMQVRKGKVVEATKNGKPVPQSQLPELERDIELVPPPAPRDLMLPPPPPAPEMLMLGDPEGNRQIEVIVKKDGGEEEVIILENGEKHRMRIMPEGEMHFFPKKEMKFMPRHEMKIVPGREMKIMKFEKDGDHGFEIIMDSVEWLSEGEAPEAFEIRTMDGKDFILNMKGLTDEQLEMAKEELERAREELKGLRYEIIEQYDDSKDEKRRMEIRIQKEVEGEIGKLMLKGPKAKFHKGLLKHKSGPGSPIERELLKAGYIESVQDYSFKMNEKRIKVDGKRITGEEYERYKRIYEKQTGKQLPDEFNISIKKDQ